MQEESKFEMVAKTFQGLEEVLAEELRNLGAEDVAPGRRMVSFTGDLAMLYRANMCCRTALRILKPIYRFTASDTEQLYDRVKQYDWSTLLSVDKTFSIDPVVYSDTFTNSRYVTYRVKDAIVDWFKDRFGETKRPGVRLTDADVMINVHISGRDVTISLDSSGESLHKRGYRVAQTEAPINEVLAAGIILMSGWRGDTPFIDPMCGSGTFLIEAAMIAAGIMPGIYRQKFAFESWPDFDADLFEEIFNDDSAEHEPAGVIYGADISPRAIAIAERNIKQAGVSRYIKLSQKALSAWNEVPDEGFPGVLVTNPPYGERIEADDMHGLYALLGTKLKHLFKGYHAWIIGYHDEYFHDIGMHPSLKVSVLNGSLECELREYISFEGDIRSFKESGGSIVSSRRNMKSEPSKQRRHKDFVDDEKRVKKDKSAKGPRKFRDREESFGKRRDRDDRHEHHDRFDRKDRHDRKDSFKRGAKADFSEEEYIDRSDKFAWRRSHDEGYPKVTGKRPSLPASASVPPSGKDPDTGVVMRSRRGWKRKNNQ